MRVGLIIAQFLIGFSILTARAFCIEPLTAGEALQAAVLGGEYLLHHQKADGTFNYGYIAELDLDGSSYNHLRHAGTCYSLLELYEATKDDRFLESGRRGIDWLTTQTRGPKPEHDEEDFLAILSPDLEAKLGGAGLALLAICKYEEVTGATTYRPIGSKLAKFIRFMQHEDGEYESKYFYREPDEKKFVSMYYPGEATLALCRLHQMDPDPEVLKTARRGADWLVKNRLGGKTAEDVPHDHWLLMALEELHAIAQDDRYSEAGFLIAEGILSKLREDDYPVPEWAGTIYSPPRSTPCSIRGEALSAAIEMAKRKHLPVDRYIKALQGLARFVVRCQIDEEESLKYPNPSGALGGVKKNLLSTEIRIDYNQHAISMWLGLRRALLDADG